MATRSIFQSELGGGSGWVRRRGLELLGALLLVAGIALAIALWGHDANDPSLNHATGGASANPLGTFGASVADMTKQTIGLAAWILAVVLALWGVRLISGRPLNWPWLPAVALPLALLAAAAFLATWPLSEAWPYWVGFGGYVGDFLLHRLERPIGPDIYPLVTGIASLILLVLAVGVTWREVWQAPRGTVAMGRRIFGDREPEPEPRWAQAVHRRLGARGERAADMTAKPEGERPGFVSRFLAGFAGTLRRGEERRRPAAAPGLTRPVAPVPTAAGEPIARALGPGAATARPPRAAPPSAPPGAGVRAAAAAPAAGELVPDGEFKLPPLKFLAQPRQRRDVALDRASLAETAKALERALDDFGVRGEIIDVRPGPVVTLYELEPAPGTRAARVISLADDIARSLCAMSVRVAVVPGRNVIGIELPNEQRETVFLRDLLSSPAYEDTAARLTLALGKDISGEPVVVDLARMPHLLIAGTTGSGKSVALNAMILSLLYRLPPDQCKLILIDPKVIELSVYEDIPHLLSPVVTEPHKAVVALKWVVREMDERYRVMSQLGVRDVFAFNRRLGEAIERGERLSRRVQTGFEPGTGVPVFEEQPIEMVRLPLIVVVVDEVADLMLTAGKEIEAAIQRLSQKARAAGIHLIVATQRPSVDVLTGVIKANLPSRISFRVSSKIDSRTILGEPGAEQLLGQGDLLFMMPGERITRIHGPLVTDEEVEQVANYLRAQGEPDYVDSVTDESALEAEGGALGLPISENGNGDDAQYAQALQIVAQEGKASTSYLQRRLRIGYNSAARLIERMEADGHVSRPDHVGRRQVLIGGAPQDEDGRDRAW
ncbi:MAG TPA: DNA translocase FtsK 4TM domain-containing protein [Geminicoccaceae bacterium]|nr:DNA translocase FtsK 4TM domain-containing protein [Geminicoccaceae bacterium]